MKAADIAFTILIIVVFLGLYLSNILAIGMKKVKDNWPLYRCSPAVMPFAKFFGHDVQDNFMQCIQTTQSSYMDYLMMPLNHVSIFKNIFGIFNNIIIGFQRIIIAMRDLVNKLAGIFSTLMFVLSGAMMVMKSLWGGIFGQMVRSLKR
jgi:hypothetical protein